MPSSFPVPNNCIKLPAGEKYMLTIDCGCEGVASGGVVLCNFTSTAHSNSDLITRIESEVQVIVHSPHKSMPLVKIPLQRKINLNTLTFFLQIGLFLSSGCEKFFN